MAVNTLPAFFRKGGEQGNATYDFYDIASGTGYITLYAGATNATNVLSNQTFYSLPVTTAATGTTTSYVKVIDIDFDVTLNRPMTLRGTALIDYSISTTETTGEAGNGDGYIHAKIRKVSGGVETEVADNAGAVCSSPGAVVYLTECIDISIPLTNYKVGDILRLTIEGYAKYTGVTPGNSNLTVSHDPVARTAGWSATNHSDLTFKCPVRIDL